MVKPFSTVTSFWGTHNTTDFGKRSVKGSFFSSPIPPSLNGFCVLYYSFWYFFPWHFSSSWESPCIHSLHSFNNLRVYPAPMCSNVAVNATLTLMGNVQLKSTTLGLVITLAQEIISTWELGSQRGCYFILN